ncbi:MAG TPA: hypothetical protein VMW42_01455 [Desulfatiglandales bacterium]|nr:hypothetical protein [Desulfatiglandales bacterium]
MMGKPISKKTHAKILSIPYSIYKIAYDRGWRDAEERTKKEKTTNKER